MRTASECFRAEAKANRIATQRGPVQVLIADDDEGFRTFMRRVLNRELSSKVVGEAVDGFEAVRKAENLKPHLVLMDLDLPRLNGLEATRRVKESLPDTVVVMFGTVDGPAYREAAVRSGADGFVVKNAPLAQILSRIRQWSVPKSGHRKKEQTE